MSEFYGDDEDWDQSQETQKKQQKGEKVHKGHSYTIRYTPRGLVDGDENDVDTELWDSYHHEGYLHVRFDGAKQTATVIPKSKL